VEFFLVLAVLLGIVNLVTRPPSRQVKAETPAVTPKAQAVRVELLLEKGEAAIAPNCENLSPIAPISPQPSPKPEPRSRKEQVWQVLDGAPEGASTKDLIALVKVETGQGTSNATIQAWRKARQEPITPECNAEVQTA